MPGSDRSPDLRLTPAAAGRLLRAIEVKAAGAPDAGLLTLDSPLPVIPGYSILEKVAEGGAGAVYRALRSGSDRPLAIKLLRAALGAGPHAARAWRELHILESLRLSCLPSLIDYGQHNGHLYIVTDFIEGEHPAHSATTLSPDHPDLRGLRSGVETLAGIADAVQSLHEHGVLHRDLKPSNIVITPEPASQVVLLDLGLASLLAENPLDTLTAEGQALGTPAFMAPEQARGERDRFSTRTDVYALGAMGYFLLTGQTPHKMNGSIHVAIDQVAHHPARPVRELIPTLPRQLAAVLEKACAFEPAARYTSAAEVATDLRRWLAGEHVLAAPATRFMRMTRWMARHPIAATAAACFAIVAATVCVTALSFAWFQYRLQYTPFDVRISDTGTSAQLLSRTDRVLHEWRASAQEGRPIPFARFLHQPAEFGGGEVVLIGFSSNAQTSDRTWAGHLCAFDARNPQRMLWSTERHDAGLAERCPSDADRNIPYIVHFGIGRSAPCVLVGDVFPGQDHPGDEIVFIQSSTGNAPSVIQIVSLRGDLLFEAWFRGTANGLVHVAVDGVETGVIVCGGFSNEWPPVDDLEPLHTASHLVYPQIVFGLVPKAGQYLGWVRPDWADPGVPAARWYKYIHGTPLYRYGIFYLDETKAVEQHGGEFRIRYEREVTTDSTTRSKVPGDLGTVIWSVRAATGELALDTPSEVGDVWTSLSLRGRLPSYDEFALREDAPFELPKPVRPK